MSSGDLVGNISGSRIGSNGGGSQPNKTSSDSANVDKDLKLSKLHK
ncbi:MAG: hypothetical protein MK033_08670 [Candidatus Caenarcaniphilales bacterium]|nr:hypothetical protein [Candidatus Caenarcaniphilales bacterium]